MISLLLPTRGRPDNLGRMYESALSTSEGKIECIVAIDDDDESYEEFFEHPMHNMTIFRTERKTLSKYWNECYRKANGDILMHCGDDIIFRTMDWDVKVKEAFARYPDNIVFVFGNDGSGVHDGKFGTHGFIHRDWAETIGYFVPPYFSSDYNDTWLNDVAKIIGRHKHVDMLTEHMHPDLGKGLLDQTHKDRLARHARDKVRDIYDSKGKERHQDAVKLLEVINNGS